MAYTGAATSLVRDGTLRVPTGDWADSDSTSALSLWPPGYPALIAVPMALGGMPAIQSARWINVVAAGVTAATVVAAVGAAVGMPAGVTAVVVVFATQAIVDVHLSVLSEPVFIALLLLTLAVMVFARDRLLLLGILATAAVMVRYAGAAVPAAVVTWTLLDVRHDVRRRMRRALGVGLLPAVAIAAWITRTALASDRHATPDVTIYGNWSVTLRQARDTVAAWLVPLLPEGVTRMVLAAIAAVILIAFVILAERDTASSRRRQSRSEHVSTLLRAASVLSLWYVVVLIASRAFVGGTIPFDWRLMAPLIVLMDVMAVTAVGYWWHAYHLPTKVMVATVAAAWLVVSSTASVNDAVYAATEGSDFASTEWRDSPLVGWVRAHGAGQPLYSNWPAALYFHAHRVARELPDSSDMDDVDEFARTLRVNGGYVVGFDARSPDVVRPDSLARILSLREVVRTADGAVWSAVPNLPATDSTALPR